MSRCTALVVAISIFATSVGCAGDDDIGIPCEQDISAAASRGISRESVVINAQARSCSSRLCIKPIPQAQALCTATCEADDDCPGVTPTCGQGFACVYGQSVEGALRCCKLCVCRDTLADPNHDPLEQACAGVASQCSGG